MEEETIPCIAEEILKDEMAVQINFPWEYFFFQAVTLVVLLPFDPIEGT